MAIVGDALDFENLGRYLFAARTRRGLTLRQLAARSGLAPASITRIEHAQRHPTLSQLASLAQALKVPIQWFSNGSNWPGVELPDLALELQALGIADLIVAGERVPGAFRPPEQVVVLAVSGNEPEPRVIEAIPAVLAWHRWNIHLLRAYALSDAKRTLYRLAWLADIALTIDKHYRFPRGCPGRQRLARFLNRVKPPDRGKDRKRSPELDGLGRPSAGESPHPVWKRWGINYGADLKIFRDRAEYLKTLLEKQGRLPPDVERAIHE